MTRQCGGCTLCCKLIPLEELHKKSGERCKHQTFKGCRIYKDRPLSCQMWNCRWLVGDDTADLPRPDRAHYVIDIMPDFIQAGDPEKQDLMQAVQLWCDPKYPDAWRTPELIAYIKRRGAEYLPVIIRFNEMDSIIVFTDGKDQWVEIPCKASETRAAFWDKVGHDEPLSKTVMAQADRLLATVMKRESK